MNEGCDFNIRDWRTDGEEEIVNREVWAFEKEYCEFLLGTKPAVLIC